MYPTLWCPKRAICEIPKHKSSQKRHQLLSSAFTWKGWLHGWTSTKANASLPASRCCASWPQPQSLSVASSASELHDTPNPRIVTTPGKLRNKTCFFFYAVMMVAGQAARNLKQKTNKNSLLPVCSSAHTAAAINSFQCSCVYKAPIHDQVI